MVKKFLPSVLALVFFFFCTTPLARASASNTEQHDDSARTTEQHDDSAHTTEQHDDSARTTEQHDDSAHTTEQHDDSARTPEQCDYYDILGDFILSFDAALPARETGTEKNKSLTLLLGDTATLTIDTTPSPYDVTGILGNTESHDNDIADFVNKYATDPLCTVQDIEGYTGKRVICGHNEYSLIIRTWQKSSFCTHIVYTAQDASQHAVYRKIVDSSVSLRNKPEARDMRQKIFELASPEWGDELHTTLTRIFCGEKRIRHLLEEEDENRQTPPPLQEGAREF